MPQAATPSLDKLRNPPLPFYDTLPDSAILRVSQLVRDPKHPERPYTLPFSASTLWRKVDDGTFPKPVHPSARTTGWVKGSVRAWQSGLTGAPGAA